MVSPNKACAICKKGYARSAARSHSMQATARRLQPNLQWMRLLAGNRVKACTKCIKGISAGKIKLATAA
ncbi:MAG: L28 family ribosomal protein [Candidatus Doudnabacteria bacterium]|nr:L28 family ribosomal protein [bacterium]MDZ4244167.1 L28 family ribosomal protein [Candidatus Doudnabacteria bacterium]